MSAPITPPGFQPPSIPPVKVSDVIYTGYRIAGILTDAGVTENPEELTDGFNALIAMLDDWNSQRLMVYTINQLTFNFVAGQQTYQLGPGAADWNFPRVPRIEQASVIITNSPTLPLEQALAPLTVQQWQRIPVKNTQSSIPQAYYYDAQFPIANFSLYPIPSNDESVNQIRLYVWNLFQNFQSVSQQIAFPPSYLLAIQYNLALELAARFPLRQKLSPWSVQRAAQAIRNIKSQNEPTLDMRCDPAACPSDGGIYNYLSDTWLVR